MQVEAVPSRDGRPGPAVVQLIDVTAAKDAAAHLAHLALHDPVTGLPNQLLLHDRLDHDLDASARGLGRVAVLHLGLVGLSTLTDIFGREVGEQVLV